MIISERETIIRDLQNKPDLSGEVRRLTEELNRRDAIINDLRGQLSKL
jgi:hypothetical protein